jgi:hypothetical protein
MAFHIKNPETDALARKVAALKKNRPHRRGARGTRP